MRECDGLTCDSLLSPRPGNALVMSALMATVLFGMLALAMDFGLLLAHRRIQQNAADAAALAAARVLVDDVAVTSGGTVLYLNVKNSDVWAKARPTGIANWFGAANSRTLTMEYLSCAGAVLGTVADTGDPVPDNTCAVRASSTASVSTLFLRAADPSRTGAGTSATATARIAPTTPIQEATGNWPVTRWLEHPGRTAICTYDSSGCVFWSNNGGPEETSIGSWKEKLYPSRYSQFDCSAPYTAQSITAYDPGRAGDHCGSDSSQAADLDHWLRYGFGGQIRVNDRVETDGGGTNGQNVADPMLAFISAAPEGAHPIRGNFRTMPVALWRDGERWNGSSWQNWGHSVSHPPDRIIVAEIRCFRFYAAWVQSSEVRGHYVSCYNPTGASLSGPPSAAANTVTLSN